MIVSHDLTVVGMILNASIVVKVVMAILLVRQATAHGCCRRLISSWGPRRAMAQSAVAGSQSWYRQARATSGSMVANRS